MLSEKGSGLFFLFCCSFFLAYPLSSTVFVGTELSDHRKMSTVKRLPDCFTVP